MAVRSRAWRPLSSGLLSVLLLLPAHPDPASSLTAPTQTPWRLGTFTPLPQHVLDCPPGFRCMKFGVTDCPRVSEGILGELAIATPATARGTVVILSGGTGETWWSQFSPLAGPFLRRLRQTDGFAVVQLRWVTAWLAAAPGEDSGSAHLACRTATAIRWIHDRLFVPLHARGPVGSCGFCVTGNSGGASETSYALSHFGLDAVIDAAVPTSGPPHAAQVKGCQPGFPDYRYRPGDLRFIESSYGFYSPGPCSKENPAWIPRWTTESVDTGGNDYSHPATRIEFVIGGQDTSVAPAHAADYRVKLEGDPSNDVTWTFVPSMPHDIQKSRDGLVALEAALLGTG